MALSNPCSVGSCASAVTPTLSENVPFVIGHSDIEARSAPCLLAIQDRPVTHVREGYGLVSRDKNHWVADMVTEKSLRVRIIIDDPFCTYCIPKMPTSKEISRRRVSSRLNPPLLAQMETPALSPPGLNAVPKTPERPIAPSRGSKSSGSSRCSTGGGSIFSASPSTPMTPGSPISPPGTTPNPSSSGLIFSKETASQTIQRRSPSELVSGVEIRDEDIKEMAGAFDHLTTDTHSMSLARRHRASSSDPAKQTSPASRPSMQRLHNLDANLKLQLDTKLKVPGAYESQNSEMEIDRASSDHHILPTTTSTQSSDQLQVADSSDSRKNNSASNRPRFKQLREPKDRRAINSSICKCIASNRKSYKDPKERKKSGWIYIFESPEYAPDHVKIGKSDSNPEQRRKDWEKCGFALQEVQGYRNAFDHYSMVESLVMAELNNSRKKFMCTEHKIYHQEWYNTDKESALKSVHRWRHWITSQRPLDETSNLTPYWRWRVEKLPKFINDVNWDTWTQPGLLDYLDYQLEQFGKGYYVQIKAHLGRKDFHFCLTGGMMIFILYTQFGVGGGIWGLLALLVL